MFNLIHMLYKLEIQQSSQGSKLRIKIVIFDCRVGLNEITIYMKVTKDEIRRWMIMNPKICVCVCVHWYVCMILSRIFTKRFIITTISNMLLEIEIQSMVLQSTHFTTTSLEFDKVIVAIFCQWSRKCFSLKRGWIVSTDILQTFFNWLIPVIVCHIVNLLASFLFIITVFIRASH